MGKVGLEEMSRETEGASKNSTGLTSRPLRDRGVMGCSTEALARSAKEVV